MLASGYVGNHEITRTLAGGKKIDTTVSKLDKLCVIVVFLCSTPHVYIYIYMSSRCCLL